MEASHHKAASAALAAAQASLEGLEARLSQLDERHASATGQGPLLELASAAAGMEPGACSTHASYSRNLALRHIFTSMCWALRCSEGRRCPGCATGAPSSAEKMESRMLELASELDHTLATQLTQLARARPDAGDRSLRAEAASRGAQACSFPRPKHFRVGCPAMLRGGAYGDVLGAAGQPAAEAEEQASLAAGEVGARVFAVLQHAAVVAVALPYALASAAVIVQLFLAFGGLLGWERAVSALARSVFFRSLLCARRLSLVSIC